MRRVGWGGVSRGTAECKRNRTDEPANELTCEQMSGGEMCEKESVKVESRSNSHADTLHTLFGRLELAHRQENHYPTNRFATEMTTKRCLSTACST